MKKFLLIIFSSFISTGIYAHDFEVDGVYYNIANETLKTCNVTFQGTSFTQYSNEYCGNIIIPKSVNYNGVEFIVTTIENYSFYGCTELTSITLNADITSIGIGAFEGCSSLSSITLGNTLATIQTSAFENCTLLKSIILPSTLSEVGCDAFKNCTFEEIYSLNPTPPSLYYNVTYQDFSGSWFEFKSYSFSNWDATVYVPQGSIDLYKADTNKWAKFGNIVEMEDLPVVDSSNVVLSIEYPEKAIVKHQYVYNSTATISISPVEGWSINTITFNDQDITDAFDENGYYTTPSLTTDSRISIVTIKNDSETTDISETVSSQIKVYVTDKTVSVIGADDASEVVICDLQGNIIYNGTDKQISIENSGIYILTIENKTFKFLA